VFDHLHYVPVLRWKKAERDALEALDGRTREVSTPLIELTMGELLGVGRKRRRTPAQYLSEMTADVLKSWGKAPAFLDLRLIHDDLRIDGRHPLSVLGDSVGAQGGRVVPVTGLGRSPRYQQAVKACVGLGNGACIRLFPRDLFSGADQEIDKLLEALAVNAPQVDLIIDCQIVAGDVELLRRLVRSVPLIEQWRSLTLMAGAFPKDLTGFKPGIHTLERTDWLHWRSVLDTTNLPRAPWYGDYVTLHAVFSEPPPGANFSASIRYACEEYWLIMRGEGVRNRGGAGYQQWTANAQLLIERAEFQGPTFSAGDNFIYRKALSRGEPGNATQWVFAGVNHHLTLVARQMAGLPVLQFAQGQRVERSPR
jgi:hypothetical protein